MEKRSRKPIVGLTSTLPDMIRRARKSKGWSLRDLEARTRELGIDDDGVTINILSFWERGVIREPKLTNLDLVARALDLPLWRLIEALGFDLNLRRDPVPNERRAAVARMLHVATDDDLGRIGRYLHLDEHERAAVDAFIESLQGRRAE